MAAGKEGQEESKSVVSNHIYNRKNYLPNF
jgi:hypothetical protein